MLLAQSSVQGRGCGRHVYVSLAKLVSGKKTSSHCPMVASVAHGNHQWVTRHACSGEPRAIAGQREAGQARHVRQKVHKKNSRASNVRVKMISDTRGRREKEVSQTCAWGPWSFLEKLTLTRLLLCNRSGQERTLLSPDANGRVSTERLRRKHDRQRSS